jgi:hypothetical protein
VLAKEVPSSPALLTLEDSSLSTELYDPRAFITHAAWLDQAFAHCPIFPTAASRRSLGRVSVPVWLIILSDQLDVFALVGRYPTNKLMSRGPLLRRQLETEASFPEPISQTGPTYAVLATLSSGCPPSEGRLPTCYSPVRRSTRDPKVTFALDLHVLGLPLTFALSQDQTLHLNGVRSFSFPVRVHLGSRRCRPPKPTHLDGSAPRRACLLAKTHSSSLFSFQRPTGFLPRSGARI